MYVSLFLGTKTRYLIRVGSSILSGGLAGGCGRGYADSAAGVACAALEGSGGRQCGTAGCLHAVMASHTRKPSLAAGRWSQGAPGLPHLQTPESARNLPGNHRLNQATAVSWTSTYVIIQ